MLEQIMPPDEDHTPSLSCPCRPRVAGNYLLHQSEDQGRNAALWIAKHLLRTGYHLAYLRTKDVYWFVDVPLVITMEKNEDAHIRITYLPSTPKEIIYGIDAFIS